MTTVSVLLTYYHETRPEDLRAALKSVAEQTRHVDQIVVVEDGPAPAELRDIARDYATTLITLPENVGAGPASQAGLKAVTGEWLMRLDADDIAAPTRVEQQLAYLAEHPEVQVLGTAVYEFDDVTYRHTGSLHQAATKIRRLPAEHQAIKRYARINSPINNPSVMMSTAAVRRAGGYQPMHRMEDYYLWVRMLAQGSHFANMPQPLTWFRTSPEQDLRRQRDMFAAEKSMQRAMVEAGLVSWPRALVNMALRSTYRALPQGLFRRVYTRLFHRKG